MSVSKLWQVLVVSALCLPSYSYSDVIYETSGNAASEGLNWVMANVLPAYTGLAVNGVVYRYTTVKEPEDDMIVHVSNMNAQGDGYIFRETNDWSGVPQNTIRRAVPLPYIPIEYWGDGSIEIEGDGEVVDPFVIYTYRYDDTCLDAQNDPKCPGYVEPVIIPEIEVATFVDPLNEDYIQQEIDRKAVIDNEDQEDMDRKRVVKSKKREVVSLEKLLGSTNETELAGESQILHNQLVMLNYVPTTYYYSLPTTTYEETLVLPDSNLPDNRKARRNSFAQEALHNQLIELQYQGE